uniref:F-box protein At5g39250 n=1 Tax=Erigeron canadensis TaxID=72917 RepID=UPI001CB92F58|nr:F-box protein At5g39250 [Erigeron canadensis]XP_043616750.1 F-box protein At5g39250 [Erigeron canadensis]XP_043616751.1 F-box protein At5g39250 [Erigeron canadensis]
MSSDEILKAVFPLLEGTDLASCMAVCKQWRNIAEDDYFWKCLCAKKWPSTCKNRPPPVTYHKLFKTFYKRETNRTLLPPRISLNDLEFYIDFWADGNLLFSEVVAGPVLQKGNWTPPTGISTVMKYYLEGPDYKLTLPVKPQFAVPYTQIVSVSVLVARKDTNKVACLVHEAMFDYIERSTCRALAFEYLVFSPAHPFVSGIRAWISLLFMEQGDDGDIDVFGIEMDFSDIANSEEEVLWLLDMLDWK